RAGALPDSLELRVAELLRLRRRRRPALGQRDRAGEVGDAGRRKADRGDREGVRARRAGAGGEDERERRKPFHRALTGPAGRAAGLASRARPAAASGPRPQGRTRWAEPGAGDRAREPARWAPQL